MRISDWSSDVCSSDLLERDCGHGLAALGLRGWRPAAEAFFEQRRQRRQRRVAAGVDHRIVGTHPVRMPGGDIGAGEGCQRLRPPAELHAIGMRRAVKDIGERPLRDRSEEHTSELQSLMRISYAVFCLKKKIKIYNTSQEKEE